ncbi:hypothetical protein [Microbulbifer sp. 2205BS26-8]|uniref:hypothetical protein n=1 Tax=Microbulbifer sp. 2205BS26-8 TaxID=3064386 RepID=UPI002740183C|nr:hypothetical protein [Microbulbifer sp. 2205BS26-8]MDP5211236.1 hypothetical protein [Microbulbifer sp. 2205BS26-8]
MIEWKFDQVVREMTENGLRRPGSGWVNGWLNNFESSLPFCPSYYGCGDQALHLIDQLYDSDFYNSLNEHWRFEIIYEVGTIHQVFPHQWVEGYPLGHESTRILLDPWENNRERLNE